MQPTKFKPPVLFIAAHTDDIELACGGLIASIVDSGVMPHLATFSFCQDSIKPPFNRDILKVESSRAASIMGIPVENTKWHDYPVRRFDEHRQDILEILVALRDSVQPQTVFIPSSYDNHQDHQLIHSEGRRAFGRLNMLGYESPNSNIHFVPNLFVPISRSQMEVKIEAINEYKSQQTRSHFDPLYIKSIAVVRGKYCGAVYAEAYEIINMVL